LRTKIKRAALRLRQLFVAAFLCAGLAFGAASIWQNTPTASGSLIIAQKAQAPVASSTLAPSQSPTRSYTTGKGKHATLSKAALIAGGNSTTRAIGTGHTPTPFHQGDVFVNTFNFGTQHFDSAGNLLDNLNLDFRQFGTGMAFKSNGHLLAGFNGEIGSSSNSMVDDYDTSGNLIGTFANTVEVPQSLIIDVAGNVYIGEDTSFGNDGRIEKFDAGGNLLATFFAPIENGAGIGSIALGSDQCTLYYTSGGVTIKRFNVCTNASLSDFATGAATPTDLQVRPNGDVLVISRSEIDRYDSSGAFKQFYPYPTDLAVLTAPMTPSSNTANVGDTSGFHIGADIIIDNEQMTVTGLSMSANSVTVTRNVNGSGAVSHLSGATVNSVAGATALALDPDGQHFWAGGSILFSGFGSPVYKYNFDTGETKLVFYAGSNVDRLAVYGLVDSDGDGLPDAWEKSGVRVDSSGNVIGTGSTGPGIFIDLPSMGADPMHKDLFVHADWMAPKAAASPSPAVVFKPTARAMQIVTDSFAKAPVDNPDHKPGINLHIDAGPGSMMKRKPLTTWAAYSRAAQIPYQHIIGSIDSGGKFAWDDLDNLKQPNFNVAGRQKIFHYALFGDAFAAPASSPCPAPCASTSSGRARSIDPTGASSLAGTDFIVTLGAWNGGTIYEQAGTFMHEFGHTLGLRHGGGDDVNYKPNYVSIMNYWFQMDGLFRPYLTRTRRNYDYSRVALPFRNPPNPVLDEANLDETIGISDPAKHFTLWNPCSSYRLFFPTSALDWSCDGVKDTVPVLADINRDGQITQLIGYEDWHVLIYDGRGKLGLGVSTSVAAEAAQTTQAQTTTDPLAEPSRDELLSVVPQALRDEENAAPLDNASYSPQQGAPGVTVNFDGTASTAVNNATIVDWFWDFGDGTTGSGASVSHTYRTGGDFYANLTVTDSNGQVNLVPLLNLVSITGNGSSSFANIIPYQPPDWSDVIVVSNVTGTNSDALTLLSSDTLYVDWAAINNGDAAVNADFIVTLYVDGDARQNFLVPHPLDVDSYAFIEDYPLGMLSGGTHIIKIVADSTGVIDPAGQTHNEYSKFITITGPGSTPTPSPTPTPPAGCTPAQMISPANGANIPSNTTFTWSTASGASRVSLHIGTQGPDSTDIYAADQGSNTSVMVGNLAGTIYVRLTTYCPDSSAQFGFDIIAYDYVYQAPNPTPTPTPTPGNCTAGAMISPITGSTIQSTTTFNWSPGTGNPTYYLFIGTKEPGGSDAFYNQYQSTITSATVKYLPEGPLYVRLRSVCSGTAINNDYIYYVPPTAAGAGGVDSGFHPTATENRGQVWSTLVQPDGKILVGGYFKSFAGCARSGIARLNADGTCDQTFDPGLALSYSPESSVSANLATDFNAEVTALALQPDGKILAVLSGGGSDALHHGLYRFHSDGSLDSTFNADIRGSGIQSIAVQPDGKILVAGAFLGQPNGAFTTLTRLNPDGSLDPSFTTMVHGGNTLTAAVDVVALQPDGKIVFGGPKTDPNDVFGAVVLGRLNSDGTRDNTFSAPMCSGDVIALALQPDGKIIAVGQLTFIGSGGLCDKSDVIARFNPDGSRDTSFIDAFSSNSGGILHLAIQANGKILFTSQSGFFTAAGDRGQVARLNSDGSLDSSFNHTGIATPDQASSIYALSLTPSGKIILGGGVFTSFDGVPAESIVQLNSDGSPDQSFAPNGPGGNADVVALVQQPNGKWLVGLNHVNGPETKLNGITTNVIGRLNADGTTDTTFASPFTNASYISGLARQLDGKVIVSGRFYLPGSTDEFDLARLNTDGSLDSTFTPPSFAGRGPLLLQPDGKIVVASLANGELILRLNSNGQLDATLQDLGQLAYVTSMVLQGDGKIIIGGLFSGVTVSPGHTVARNNIARLNADGSADVSFDPGSGPSGGNTSPARTMVLQPDGKILIGGTFTDYNGTARPNIARLNSNGSLDTSFVPVNPNTGQFGAQGVGAIALQLDGKVIVGPDREDNPASPMSIFRLNPDGSLDQTFALRSGIAAESTTIVNVIRFDFDPGILIGGAFDIVDGEPRMALARLLPAASAPAFTHRLVNISTRGFAQTGDDVIIGGLIISGTGSKQVLFRALGPTLGQPPFNVPNVLTNPVLELHLPGGAVIANDNWQQSNDAALIPARYQPSNVNESAMLMALPPGAYTAIMRGANNGTGNSLFEAYDADSSGTTSRLVNISTRGFVQTGAGVMIAGFIVQGPDNQTVVVRGLGPTLGQSPFNVPNVLADPLLDLHDGNGNQLSTNDNWASASNRQAIVDSGLAPPNSSEAAILITLPPGSYTAILRGVNNTTGNALVEVYAVD
jgi:uncharacterized delta-60 repeat protein